MDYFRELTYEYVHGPMIAPDGEAPKRASYGQMVLTCQLPHRHLALELLRKLIHDEIQTRMRKNVVQARSFSEMLERAIRQYPNHAVETAQVIRSHSGSVGCGGEERLLFVWMTLRSGRPSRTSWPLSATVRLSWRSSTESKWARLWPLKTKRIQEAVDVPRLREKVRRKRSRRSPSRKVGSARSA